MTFDSGLDYISTNKMLGMVTKVLSSNLGRLFLMDMGIQWGAFVVANHFQTDKFYDLTGKPFKKGS